MTPLAVSEIGSNIYRKHEESAKKTISLRQKELKWKLMQASQIQNLAKLEEMRIETESSKQRMVKVSNLASKLRAKYIKACKLARDAQLGYKQTAASFSEQEKFVAQEKMQLTRLGVDCRRLGKQLYGQDYKLSLSPNKRASKRNIPTRLSSLYDLRNSQLRNLASYRLTRSFQESSMSLIDLRYNHNLRADCDICISDLQGTCQLERNGGGGSCPYQHETNYIMSHVEQLADILSYRPSLIGFKFNSNLSKAENENECRLRLKQYAVRLLAKNSDKSIEQIMMNLIKYVQSNKSELELLLSTRKIPKRSTS